MNAVATSRWTSFARRRPALAFADSALRGSGQVVFMDNPLSGLLNLAALCWGAWAGGSTWIVVAGAIAGMLVATLTAWLLPVDRTTRSAGLYGFNGLLVGAGLFTFLAATPATWTVLVLACAASTVLALALGRALAPWQLPGLTFPFVLTTWLMLLAAQHLTALPAITAAPLAAVSGPGGFAGLLRASLVGVAQVFFVDNPVSGTIFLLALAVESRWCAGLALGGALLANGCALALGADANILAHGLWAYSAALTAPAIGCVFLRPSPRSLLVAIAATLFTALLQGATAQLAGRFSLPTLTFPFVLATWVFLLAGQALKKPT